MPCIVEKTQINKKTLKLEFKDDGASLSFADIVALWKQDSAFTTLFIEQLANCPFSSFKWETPAVTSDTMEQAFQCVFLDAPYLGNRRPDTLAFSRYLDTCDDQHAAATFPNLGGDALLVAPLGLVADEHYVDLASFSRNAPVEQQIYLWKMTGEAMSNRIGTRPLWLSTAGGGVAWLHIRLDDWPKYYGYTPYRAFD